MSSVTEPSSRENTPECQVCLNCGEVVSATFCGSCGQRHIPEHNHTISVLVWGAIQRYLEELRPLRTLWRLLTRPGALTNDWMAGKRRQQSHPLVALVFYTSVFLVLESYLPTGVNDTLAPVADDRVKAFVDAMTANKELVSQAVVIPGQVAIYFGVLSLVFWRRAAPLRHAVLSVHIVSTSLLCAGLGVLLKAPLMWMTGASGESLLSTHLWVFMTAGAIDWIIAGGFAVYLTSALQRVYALSLARALTLTLGLFVARFVVFVVVIGALVVPLVVMTLLT
jgi:hypothetical protein